MLVNVIELLRPIRIAEKAKAVGALDALAKRLSGGERVSPDEISATLERTKATPEQLQAEVDRQARLVAIKDAVRAGNAARRRLDQINAELKKAREAVDAAQSRSDDVFATHEVEWRTLRDTVKAADEAAMAATKRDCLSAEDAARLDAIDDELRVTAEELRAARDTLSRIPELVAEAKAERIAQSGRDTPAYERAQRTLDARRGRLAEAEREVARLVRQSDDATKRRDALYESIRRAVGA